MTTTIQRTDYTKNGYGKKILLDLINSPMEKSRAYYNNMHNYSFIITIVECIKCFLSFYANNMTLLIERSKAERTAGSIADAGYKLATQLSLYLFDCVKSAISQVDSKGDPC